MTATFAGGNDRDGYRGLDPFNTAENGASLNWFNQGADAGRYTNDDIHAIRILVMEPTTDRNRGPKSGRLFLQPRQRAAAHPGRDPGAEVRTGDKQPLDPDGNPDTSFLAKIPADVAFTFQTLDKDGMVLNMAQTWHQLRPGEIRNDCGGCHAHSQKPTPFEKTAAAKPDYEVFDLTQQTPLLTTKAARRVRQEVGREGRDRPALREGRQERRVFPRRQADPRPQLRRLPHARSTASRPATSCWTTTPIVRFGNEPARCPGTYYRLAVDSEAQFGHKPVIRNGQWRQTNASRYVRMFQSRRSLLIWKVFGRALDGWTNDDFPTETMPGDPNTLQHKGKPVADTPQNRDRADLDLHRQRHAAAGGRGRDLRRRRTARRSRWRR